MIFWHLRFKSLDKFTEKKLLYPLHGLAKVDEACANALKVGVSNADFIKQYLNPTAPQEKIEERQLELIEAPSEDLHCYNDIFQIGSYQETPHAM